MNDRVLLSHKKVKLLVGIRYSIIRGLINIPGVENRKTSRSKYGVSKPSK